MTDPTRAALEQAANELDIAENALLCSSFHNAASRAKQAAMTARAALSQPEPAGLSVESGMIPMEYADVDSGARIVCEPSEDRPSTGCWVVCNSRHISPLKEFPTAEAAYHALRAAIAADRAQRQPAPPEPGEVQELVSTLMFEADAENPPTDLQWATREQLRRAADLLAQRYPQPVPVSEWRTIDTAPKDGTEILASDYDAVEILSWRKGRFELGIPGEWISRDGQAFFPAWWQPLAGHPALPLPGEVEG